MVVLGPPAPELRFQLRQDGRTADVDLDQAQCVLQVTTRFADDGRLALHFTPAIQYGNSAATPRPGTDPSGPLRWEVQTERPTEEYAGLAWDLTVDPNTYVAVGALADRNGTLGPAALVSGGPPRTQRLLVLRVGRAAPDGAAKEEEPDGRCRWRLRPAAAQPEARRRDVARVGAARWRRTRIPVITRRASPTARPRQRHGPAGERRTTAAARRAWPFCSPARSWASCCVLLILATGGWAVYLVWIVAAIGLFGLIHYLLWGRLLLRQTAGEQRGGDGVASEPTKTWTGVPMRAPTASAACPDAGSGFDGAGAPSGRGASGFSP